jgi:hypothetical protein
MLPPSLLFLPRFPAVASVSVVAGVLLLSVAFLSLLLLLLLDLTAAGFPAVAGDLFYTQNQGI